MTATAVARIDHGMAEHYRTPSERTADRYVHLFGLAAAGIGAITISALAVWRGGLGQGVAISIYALCMLAMLSGSAAYNLARSAPRRAALRRYDHAGIFLMIAGSYTPFTTQRFEGAWAVGMTIAVWSIALLGAAGKLFLPGVSHRFWLVVYLALGWLALVALQPLLSGVSLAPLILLVVGGAIYTIGVSIYVRRTLPFRRAIWHSFVFVAAAVHYSAVLTGVVFGAARI